MKSIVGIVLAGLLFSTPALYVMRYRLCWSVVDGYVTCGRCWSDRTTLEQWQRLRQKQYPDSDVWIEDFSFGITDSSLLSVQSGLETVKQEGP